MTSPHINHLREHLMSTLADLRDRKNPMEPDRARAVATVAGVLVDSARVEVDFLRITGQDRSGFLESPSGLLPASANDPSLPTANNPFPGVRRHALGG